MRIRRESPLLLVCAVMLACNGGLWAADDARLAARIKPLVSRHQGQVAIVVRHLDSGREMSWQPAPPLTMRCRERGCGESTSPPVRD